eukprot:1096620-Rhodomonas_salina.4
MPQGQGQHVGESGTRAVGRCEVSSRVSRSCPIQLRAPEQPQRGTRISDSKVRVLSHISGCFKIPSLSTFESFCLFFTLSSVSIIASTNLVLTRHRHRGNRARLQTTPHESNIQAQTPRPPPGAPIPQTAWPQTTGGVGAKRVLSGRGLRYERMSNPYDRTKLPFKEVSASTFENLFDVAASSSLVEIQKLSAPAIAALANSSVFLAVSTSTIVFVRLVTLRGSESGCDDCGQVRSD